MKKFAVVLMALGLGFLALAPTANANQGGSAVVGATVGETSVTVTSTKGLSRVTIVTCDEVLVFDSWEGEQLNAIIPVEGTVEAVFIHSGDNTTSDAQDLLADLAGDDAVKGNSTGAVAYYNADACQPEVPTTTTTTAPPTTTTTEPPVVTTTTAPPVVVPTTQPPVVAPPVEVLPVTVVAPVAAPTGELPHTGFGASMLALIGGLAALVGLALLAATRRNAVRS